VPRELRTFGVTPLVSCLPAGEFPEAVRSQFQPSMV
jgi:hypothetical protein